MKTFEIYYVLCLLYCFSMAAIKDWTKNERAGLGTTPALDSLVILIMCWALAPVDIFMTWLRLYTQAKNKILNKQCENLG